MRLEFLDELVSELYADLTAEISEDDDNFSEKLLLSKVKAETREVLNLRHYPTHYTEDMILEDMWKLYSSIRGRTIAAYNMIGVENEYSHSEKNISRTYRNKGNQYPITPIVNIV